VTENLIPKKLEFIDLQPIENKLALMATSDELTHFLDKTDAIIKLYEKKLEYFSTEIYKQN